jgi:ribonuclease VapC
VIEFVLDSSAVLAELHREPGGAFVEAARPTACMSSVNYSEVLVKLIDEGVPPHQAEEILEHLHLVIVDADKHRSLMAGLLREKTRRRGISLGDRFCLQLAQELQLPVLTTDRRWKTLDLGVEVTLIR